MKKPVRVLDAVIAAAMLAVLTGCSIHVSSSTDNSGGDLNVVTNITQKAEISADIKALEVDNRFGAIRITGADSGVMEWSWALTVRARSDALAQQAVDAASCKAERNGDQLRLAVSLPETRGHQSSQSDLEIRVPKSISVRSKNVFGKTEVADIGGDVNVTGQHGSVEIRNVSGEVRAQTAFGRLTATEVGPATLKNQHGSIEARGIRGPLVAETMFASLHADGIKGPATLRNQNGGIEATGIGGPLDAETSFASLVASDITGPVNLRNQNGKIEVTKAGGNAVVKTSFAHLTARNIAGDVTLRNQNGGVEAGDIAGSVQAATSFASMNVSAAGPNFICRNQNGAIRLRATTALTSLSAQTSFGALEVRLPGDLKPAIAARTSFGEVESDFPVLMKMRGWDVLAELAPNTPRINLENQNGRIRIVRE